MRRRQPRLQARVRNCRCSRAPRGCISARYGTSPGGDPATSTLSDEGLLDDSWHQYLRTALAGLAGWNLRNELDHGFLDNVGAIPAAVMLQCAAHLTVIPLVLSARVEAERTASMTSDRRAAADEASERASRRR